MEFIILAGFLLFMLITILAVVSHKTIELQKKRDVILGEDLVTKVQKEINLAANVLDGYSRKFTLPQKIGSKDYTIVINGNEVIVTTDQQDYWRVIPNVTGNVQIGANTINKTNGTIYIG